MFHFPIGLHQSSQYKCRNETPFTRVLQMNSPGNCFESEKAGSPRCIAGVVRPIVLTFLDIFKHLRGSGMVDKIKKCCRGSPRGFLLPLAVGSHLTLPVRCSQSPRGVKSPRESLSVFHIILCLFFQLNAKCTSM